MVTQCYAGKKQTRKPLHGSSSSAHACPQGWRTWLGLSAPAQVPRSAELRWAEPGGLGLAHLLHEVFGSHCGHLDCQGPAHSFYWLFIQDIYKMQSGCYLYWLLEKKVKKKKNQLFGAVSVLCPGVLKFLRGQNTGASRRKSSERYSCTVVGGWEPFRFRCWH